MDTKKDSSVSDVPAFKVARVGNDRKRRGGAFSFLRGGGSRGSWTGATGGSGAGGAGGLGGLGGFGSVGGISGAGASALGLNFTKAMLVIMATAAIGSGAVYLGARSAASAAGGAKKPAIFAQDKGDIKLEGDTSNLPSSANTIPNSLGYLTGSRDGLTPEERAKKAAEAAAAEEAQRLADEEAARKAEEERLAQQSAPDPNALLAAAQADGAQGRGGSAFGKKFGSLSTSMGGGSSLSGGAGLSGGVNRNFGSAGNLKKPAAASGQMTAMKGAARPSYAKSGGARLAGSNTKGFARKQLANANAYSRRGSAASRGENASSDAGTAFDNNPGAGNIISGPGIGQGRGSSGTPDATTGGGTDTGGPTGGPTGDPTVDCGPNHYQTADGGCAPIKINKGKDANPMLTMISNVVMALLLTVGVIAAMAMSGPWGYWMAGVLVAIGAVIALLGVAMMAMGDFVAGGIATLTGGIISYLAWGATPALTVGQGLIAGFGAPALMMVSKMLGGGGQKGKAPEAAQQ